MSNIILISILSMGGLGLLLGAGLAIASKQLAVETDPKVDAILEVL
ncbi:MAG TPA: electron transporter RnfB, partial [Tepidanaerobacter syntrophicus]|nr:electron transporter RnfB [Tepidanaerobacter syntrophicus]